MKKLNSVYVSLSKYNTEERLRLIEDVKKKLIC